MGLYCIYLILEKSWDMKSLKQVMKYKNLGKNINFLSSGLPTKPLEFQRYVLLNAVGFITLGKVLFVVNTLKRGKYQ